MPAQPQSLILVEGVAAGFSLEFDIDGDPREGLRRLRERWPENVIAGVGAPLCEALGSPVPGLRPYTTTAARATLPASQHALWALVIASAPGEAFERARSLEGTLRGSFRLVEQTPLFRYRDGRDLTDYLDGAANPTGAEAAATAFVSGGPLAGCSFAFVQRFVHDLEAFARLDRHQRDNVVGRAHEDNEELPDAPASAHVKRTAQEEFSPPSFMVRRSMPWGDLRRHGLQFVAFGADLDRFERVLRRMTGGDDGLADALLAFTRAETGGFYLCPPLAGGRLDLSLLSLSGGDDLGT